jgi:hypothetical protein
VPTSRARENQRRRASNPTGPTVGGGIKAFSAQFASFAATIQTRVDNNGGGTPAALTGSVEAQVERALTQVLRQGGPQAQNGAYRPGAAIDRIPGGTAVAGLPTDQAVLAGEAAVVQADLLAALDALQSLSELAQSADLAAYRSVVRAEVLALTSEFARVDRPRPPRVRVLLGALLGWGCAPGNPPIPAAGTWGDVEALTLLLNLAAPVVDSAMVEDQRALQQILRSDAERLLTLWIDYLYPTGAGASVQWSTNGFLRPVGGASTVWTSPLYGALVGGPPKGFPGSPGRPLYPSFRERMIRADLVLPVLARDCDQVVGALDAIGFGPGPRELTPLTGLLTSVDQVVLVPAQTAVGIARDVPGPSTVGLPVLLTQGQAVTISDVLGWATDLASGSGYDLLRQAGQLGLDLLADQADELFWIVGGILARPPLPALGDAQVALTLGNLARDLSALADLSN